MSSSSPSMQDCMSEENTMSGTTADSISWRLLLSACRQVQARHKHVANQHQQQQQKEVPLQHPLPNDSRPHFG